MPNNHTNEPLYNLSLVKSNEMISAKYKSTLLENQVMAIALTRIEVKSKDNESPLEARLYPRELKKLVSDEKHIYRDLKTLSKSITGHTMLLEDGKGNFKAFSMIPNAEYEDGVFIIKFNDELREHILGLESNFAKLELPIMMGFKKNSSFRIYELLKKDLYKSRPDVNDGRVDVVYNISEFRFIIGLANGDDPVVIREMDRMGRNLDWDVLYEKLDMKDRKYVQWYELQRNVLIPAQKELEEKSDLRFEFKGLRKGHKMAEIEFHIYKNKPSKAVLEKNKEILREEIVNRQLEIPLDLDIYKPLYDELIGHNELTKEDVSLLLKKANYDIDRVRDAVEQADRQPYINNYMGWIIACLANDNYMTVVDTIDGSHDKATTIKLIQEEYEEGKRTGEIQKKAWERIQKKDDFPEFTEMIKGNNLTIEQVLSIYSLDEVIQMYTDWKLGRPVMF